MNQQNTDADATTAPTNEDGKKIAVEYHGKRILVDLPPLPADWTDESKISQGTPFDYEAEARANAREACRFWLKYEADESELEEIARGDDLGDTSESELSDELQGLGSCSEKVASFRLAGNWGEVRDALDEFGLEPSQELEIWRDASRADAYASDAALRNSWGGEWATMCDAVRDAFEAAGIDPDAEDDEEEPENENEEGGAE